MRCAPATDFTVGKALAWRSAIDADVPYQRESFVWSLEKQQLFIDSLLNGYDVPKIYLHDLRGIHPTKVYAIVDGKQRLTTIWRFLRDGFPLAPDFQVIKANLPALPQGTTHPRPGSVFSRLHPAWQKVLTTTFLSVVLITGATVDDIDELFARLNNGEPLNAAEKRNAMGGGMARLIRELVRHPYFTDRLPFGNERYQHLDLAAKFLLIEDVQHQTKGAVPDLRSDALDGFVRWHRTMTNDEHERLKEWALVPLSLLCRIFGRSDPLLSSAAGPALLYLFVKATRRKRRDLSPTDIRALLEIFEMNRRAELEAPEDARDASLAEFTLLSQASNDSANLRRRLDILMRECRGGVLSSQSTSQSAP